MAEFVPYTRRETYQLHNIPAPHRRNIQRRATQKNTSFANIVGKALSDRYGFPFVPSPRRHAERTWNRTSLTVRLPPIVMYHVRVEATLEHLTIRSVILNALSDAFGLKRPQATHVGPGSRPGRRKGK